MVEERGIARMHQLIAINKIPLTLGARLPIISHNRRIKIVTLAATLEKVAQEVL